MDKQGKDRSTLKWHGWLGLAIIAASEVLLFYGVPFVRTFFTPLAWTGYILFIDSLVYRNKGTSLILKRPKEFVLLLPLSIVFWLIFEFYNLYLQNWHYVGLPGELPWRLFGYVWAFATIWPAILETAEALEGWKGISRWKMRPLRISRSSPGRLFRLRGFLLGYTLHRLLKCGPIPGGLCLGRVCFFSGPLELPDG